jgi:Protein of unknown function (DUF2695).
MLSLSEIQAEMQQAQKACQRGVFDLAAPAKNALPLLDKLEKQLQTYLDIHPDDATALKYMSYIQCHLLHYEKALPFLEKSCRLSKDRKDQTHLATLRELLARLESLALRPEQIIALIDYVENALQTDDCDHSLRLTEKWLKAHVAPDIHETALAGLQDAGGYCDCEVIFNVTND